MCFCGYCSSSRYIYATGLGVEQSYDKKPMLAIGTVQVSGKFHMCAWVKKMTGWRSAG